MTRGAYRQAAAVPWRKARDRLQILLITPRDGFGGDACRWILPQGGVEPGQTAREAAVAEAWEEAGIRGAASSEAFTGYTYEIGVGRCDVQVFHLEVEAVEEDWPERGERRRVWLPYEEALATIAGETLKNILRKFDKTMTQVFRVGSPHPTSG